MKKLLTSALMLLCVAFMPAKAFSFNYILGDTLYPYSTQSQPAKGASYTDATYNTTVTRFTSGASESGSAWGCTSEYSTYSPESSDKNWVVVEGISSLSNSSGYHLYNGAGAYVGSLSAYIQSWNGQEPEVRWDNSGLHPSWLYYRKNMQLRYYDVSAKTDNLVHDFSSDFPSYSGYFVWNGDEGNCSEDSRYWSFMIGNSNANIPMVFTYDKTQDKVISSHSTGGHAPNNVFMSKSGAYIYVAYSASGAGGEYDGPHVYKNDFSSNVKICNDVPHAVPAYDAQGNEVIFFMQSTANYADYVQFVRCDNGAVYPLYNQANLGWNSSNCLHSTPGKAKKGWGFISTYSIGSGHTSDMWDYNQIFAFELDETKTSVTTTKPRIWRVSHTQNFPNSSYYYNQPNAAITTDGQRIYWGADWRDSSLFDDKERATLAYVDAAERFQRRRDGLSILVGNEVQAVAQQMDDAGLYGSFREDGGDRLRKALQAVDNGDQDILDAAIFQLVHDAQPELGALVLFEPHAENLLAAVVPNAERDMNRFVAHQAFIADLDPQGVEENQRIDRLERPGLPSRDFLQNRVGDHADQFRRDVDAIEFVQMPDDLPVAHAAGVHRDHFVVEAGKAALVFGDQRRIETR